MPTARPRTDHQAKAPASATEPPKASCQRQPRPGDTAADAGVRWYHRTSVHVISANPITELAYCSTRYAGSGPNTCGSCSNGTAMTPNRPSCVNASHTMCVAAPKPAAKTSRAAVCSGAARCGRNT